MKNLFRFIFASTLFLHLITAHSSNDEKETHLTCAAYYYTLSLYSPKFVNDLTSDQAVKASFAFRKQVDGVMHSRNSEDAFMSKWMALIDEIVKPANQEAVSNFRNKYENTCRPLLQKVWCDAYKEHSKTACID